MTASTTLFDIAIVTFDVDPAALARVLPSGIRPDIRLLNSGKRRSFVSAVSFRDRDFRFAALPWVKRTFNQINYRAYIIGPDGQPAVFFFHTTLASALALIPKLVWSMPWQTGRLTIDAQWEGDRLTSYRLASGDPSHMADVILEGSHERAGRLDGFAGADDAALTLTHPLDGYFTRRDGLLGRYEVWHDRMQPVLGRAQRAEYRLFTTLELVPSRQPPHSVLLQHSIDFHVVLPPVVVTVQPSEPDPTLASALRR
jgi:hypothetical protein